MLCSYFVTGGTKFCHGAQPSQSVRLVPCSGCSAYIDPAELPVWEVKGPPRGCVPRPSLNSTCQVLIHEFSLYGSRACDVLKHTKYPSPRTLSHVLAAMIKFVLMVNKMGQTRVSSYYDWMPIPERVALEAEVVRRCFSRSELQCSFFEFRGYKIIYRRVSRVSSD